VCTKCSGLFRAFSHRVKGISMSNFSQEEVDQLVKGGNGVAKKIWMATWVEDDYPIPDVGDEKRIKGFIKFCFERGGWKELPLTEPLENLVGKDTVKNLNLRIAKNQPAQQPQVQNPPIPTLTHPPIQNQQQEFFEPFVNPTTTPGQTNEWDPFGSPITPTPNPAASLPGNVNHNPFSGFSTQPVQPPTMPMPMPPSPTNPMSTLQPQKHVVDPRTLFISTPTTVQPPNAVPTPLHYVSPYPYGVPPAVYQPYVNPWVQPITVKPQVQVVQTGPDAFSGLMGGFGGKPSVNAIKYN